MKTLLSECATDNFVEDLYYRINEFTHHQVPELKDRGSDLFLLPTFFMRQADDEFDRHVSGFTQAAQNLLASYLWPGNLRELNNVVKRATLLAQGELIGTDELRLTMNPEATGPHDGTSPRRRHRKAAHSRCPERPLVGNKSKAARLPEVDRKTLYNKLKKYGME